MIKSVFMIQLGFSPCPNDTFIFYALANSRIDAQGLDFNVAIEDVETLNHLAMKRLLDVTKISCHTFYYLRNDYRFLSVGGAFGHGCGPLLVAKDPSVVSDRKKDEAVKIAIPGRLTTAFLLLRLYLSAALRLKSPSFVFMPFHEIMKSVKDGKVDAGLIIHEGRFTYHEHGLIQIADLGTWWEALTGLPLPLGGIIAKKSLGDSTIEKIKNLIRSSLQYSLLHREEAMPYIKKHAQELSEEVINKHISLYVNNYTLDAGNDGKAALNELFTRADRLLKEPTVWQQHL
ncbi:MAG: 1,4-dihydroxy-6-naphthoate synthase [Dissulfurispiraceae bacterium]